ncbi:hypothetical protein FIBSPDRAFT_924173 [Athelia psychrophila]|uniref:F-box domain-containing protein n=1 Tax=Athelia psychrophila TaxID=1759441 RepID=A0A166XG91_9AGAM|nr:hypothetical protein FIBSPDRAFT_924173 [Fibularhizoctonia sp. CBS 109695]
MPYPKGRVAAFLSRAKLLPLDIYLEYFRPKDFSSNFLQLLSDHIGHLRHLRIDAKATGLTMALEYISLRPMPLLESIDLNCGYEDILCFYEPLSPFGVPRLTTARLGYLDIKSLHRCIPAFASLISLQLKCIFHPKYSDFRGVLMALPSLRHLELYVVKFNIPSPPTHLPILLPHILHLHVQGNGSECTPAIYNLLSCIQAENLVALSLPMSTDKVPTTLNAHAFEPHFPSLQHLLLNSGAHSVADLSAFAWSFPDIRRLTFEPAEGANIDIHQLLGILIRGAGDGDTAENNARSGLLWPELQSIAFATSIEHLHVPRLKSTILQLQAAGHPISKLLLLEKVHAAMVEVGEIIEIEEYYVDWPTTFEQRN